VHQAIYNTNNPAAPAAFYACADIEVLQGDVSTN